MCMRHSHLWPAPFYNIFPHYLKNDTTFGKSYWTQNVCYELLYNFCLKHSHSKKNSARFNRKCIFVFMPSANYSSHILMKLEFSRHIFEKFLNIAFHENPSVGAELFHAESLAPPPAFKTRTFQPVTSRNTDFAIPSPQNYCMIVDNFRSETPGKFWNVVLEKDGKDQLDRSCEKWRSIT